MNHRFRGQGFYVLDEPEAALSPQRQLSLLAAMHDLAEHQGSQLLIATHSPILMAYPNATLYQLSDEGIAPIAYDATTHVQLTPRVPRQPGALTSTPVRRAERRVSAPRRYTRRADPSENDDDKDDKDDKDTRTTRTQGTTRTHGRNGRPDDDEDSPTSIAHVDRG